MTARRASLKQVSTTVLSELREAIASGILRTPVDRAALVGFVVRHQLEGIEHALAGHKTAACLSVLDVALAEREDRRPPPGVVWKGPEAPAGTARAALADFDAAIARGHETPEVVERRDEVRGLLGTVKG